MSKPDHKNYVDFEVWGDYALFSDVLTRSGGEKSTYSIPTYEALKGVICSIYWKPTIVWQIEPNPQKKTDLAYYSYLCNVRYQVRAYFEWNDNRPELSCDHNENKHHNIAKRMVERGGRRDIFLGTRECQAYVKPCVFGEEKGFYDNSGEVSYGICYHGITYADEAVLPEDKGRSARI